MNYIVPHMVLCPVCESYDGETLAAHWSNNPDCHAPEPSQRQKELLVGVLMGDGTINDHSPGNPFLAVNMTNETFLDWLSYELGVFSTDVRMSSTSTEQYQNASKYYDNTNKENYNDVYTLQTRSIPWLKELNSWYSSGSKRFPESLELTPTIGKMWYVCDGSVHYYTDSSNAHIQISASNESHREEYIKDLWSSVGFDGKFGNNSDNFRFTVSESKDVLEWFGKSPPGFAYKWEIRNREMYDRLR